MGRKRTLERYKNIFYLACSIGLMLFASGCQYNYYPQFTFETVEGKKGRAHLVKAEEKIQKQDFKGAMIENRKAYEYFQPELKQEAIFQKALIYAHPENPAKDFEKALLCFDLIDQDHENSVLTCNAPLVLSILKQAIRMEAVAENKTHGLETVHGRLARKQKENQILKKEKAQQAELIKKLERQIRQLKKIDLDSIKDTGDVQHE